MMENVCTCPCLTFIEEESNGDNLSLYGTNFYRQILTLTTDEVRKHLCTLSSLV